MEPVPASVSIPTRASKIFLPFSFLFIRPPEIGLDVSPIWPKLATEPYQTRKFGGT